MADITMCYGLGCKLKDMCYRHTAPEGMWQAYFTNPPHTNKGKKCEMFWGDASKQLTDKLNDIVNGKA